MASNPSSLQAWLWSLWCCFFTVTFSLRCFQVRWQFFLPSSPLYWFCCHGLSLSIGLVRGFYGCHVVWPLFDVTSCVYLFFYLGYWLIAQSFVWSPSIIVRSYGPQLVLSFCCLFLGLQLLFGPLSGVVFTYVVGGPLILFLQFFLSVNPYLWFLCLMFLGSRPLTWGFIICRL